jgi:ribonuclease E
MMINARDFDQMRVAIVNEKGLLEQIDFESFSSTTNLGNVYKATITAIEPSLQATFVDYGGNRHGFLPFNELHPSYFTSNDRRIPAHERIKVGQEVIAQVAREEIGLKGAYLTTFLSLPGQYLVMMPLTSKVGISRKIETAEDRNRLRAILDTITVPDGMGYIIRTAGLGKSREQIQRDLNILTTTYRELESRAKKMESPCLLYKEDDVVSRTIRDYFNEDVTEILVDERDVYDQILAYFKKILPNYAHIVRHYRGRSPLFSKYNLEEQIEKVFARKINLPSGGSIVIEQTEALVVIDVNSGKTSEGNLEQTASKANLEAADEVARQLRLRDLGGLVVIDFIDLRDRRNSQEVEQRLREALKQDKARITISGLSRFGLLEMSRQRIKTSKDVRHFLECPVCNGLGRLKASDFQALDLLRRIKSYVQNGTVKELRVTLSEDLALYVLNERRSELMELETKFNCAIKLQAKHGYGHTPHFDVTRKPQEEEKEDMVMPAPLSLSSMAASMSEKDINQQKDYREEKLETLEKLSFEELRNVDVPIPPNLSPFDRFNFSVRVMMMKRHGLYETRLDEFKTAIRDKVMNSYKDKDGGKEALAEASSESSDNEVDSDGEE